MSKVTPLVLSAVVCSLVQGVALATQPPDVVSSDSSNNTAMGSYSMIECH
jgi:hypothetical protein